MANVHVPVWNDLISGGIAGTAGIIIGHPFDTIKVRLQQQQQRNHFLKKNIQVLFKGIGPPVLTAAIVNACIFTVYGASSRWWDEWFVVTDTAAKRATCGFISGFASSIFISPVDHIKIQQQTSTTSTPSYKNVMKRIWTSNSTVCNSSSGIVQSIKSGIQNLYRGLSVTALRQSISLSVYFPTYHAIKEAINKRTNNSTGIINDKYNQQHLWSSVLAGGLAGCISWTIIYPIDVIKSRIQASPTTLDTTNTSIRCIASNIISSAANSSRSNNNFIRTIKAFTNGWSITMFRAFPVNATIFCAYEIVNQWLVPPSAAAAAAVVTNNDTYTTTIDVSPSSLLSQPLRLQTFPSSQLS